VRVELISARRSILITASQAFGGMGQGRPGPRMHISAKVAEKTGQDRKARGADFKKEHGPFLFVICRRS
jgi:hypothetical protein